MSQHVCWVLVVVLALVITVPPCQSQEADMFAVVVDVDEDSMSVQMGGELDICKAFACPSGFKCEMVMSPALLKIPVPRCVPDKTAPVAPDNERCMTVNVATNILQCKTEEQWTSVGNTQCKLTSFQGQKTVLVNSRAIHRCPSIALPFARRFLGASFSCCLEDDHTTISTDSSSTTSSTSSSDSESSRLTTDPPPATPSANEPEVTPIDDREVLLGEEQDSTTGHSEFQVVKDTFKDLEQEVAELTGLNSDEPTQEETSNVFYLLLLVLGLSFLLSFLLISLLVSIRLKQQRLRKRQKKAPTVLASVINTSAGEAGIDSNNIESTDDKSSLVNNMQVSF